MSSALVRKLTTQARSRNLSRTIAFETNASPPRSQAVEQLRVELVEILLGRRLPRVLQVARNVAEGRDAERRASGLELRMRLGQLVEPPRPARCRRRSSARSPRAPDLAQREPDLQRPEARASSAARSS